MSTFIKTDSKMKYTLGVVYAPDEVDSQEDFSTADEIEKACHGFMRNLQGRRIKKGALGFMHKDWSDDIGDIVECYVAPVDMTIGDAEIKKGTWLLGAVWSDDIFQKIEDREITGYSMGGTGTREKVDEVAKQDGESSTRFAEAMAEVLEKFNPYHARDGKFATKGGGGGGAAVRPYPKQMKSSMDALVEQHGRYADTPIDMAAMNAKMSTKQAKADPGKFSEGLQAHVKTMSDEDWDNTGHMAAKLYAGAFGVDTGKSVSGIAAAIKDKLGAKQKK